ncbi:cobaltochelatase subunit CobN [Rhodoferax antarcticus]|uniref:cobaltochelatase subunit CobN n=1 Tax=Rhodoferax antarcticus TaxID=81479 RepID=UPI0022240B27|nr:cobaltochelatase subunit CobN [Rhodoferax antarcticus]MCW2313631.1 cobaltochelatase CobN [Rhodoferax antarcticus]
MGFFKQARRFGLRLIASWFLLSAPVAALAASVLFVTTSPITPGKFKTLSAVAAPHGIQVEARFVEKLARVDAGLWEGFDAVIFDAPRDHIQEAIVAKVNEALPALALAKTPVLWLHASKPQWSNLQDDLAKRLHAYYVNGGRANHAGFFTTLAAYLAQTPWQNLTPPQVFAATAIYHPKAPQLVFDNAAAYLRWNGGPQGRPVVAIAFHQQSIAAEQTGLIDDLITRIEAAGAVPLAFYSPVMDNAAMTQLLAPEGKSVANVLINTQILLNPEGRRAEFDKLGIPVIQAMAYKNRGVEAWRNDPVGIPLMDVPFYLSQPEYAGVFDVMVAAATDQASDQLQAIPEQAAAVVGKAIALARLARLTNADKKVALMFWNYPPGERNLGASFMNLPTSLEATLAAMKAAGYRTETPNAATLTRQLQRLLKPFYRPATVTAEMNALVRDGLAELMPLATYKTWLANLPEARREAWITAVGPPDKSVFSVQRDGQDFFAVPRLKLGNISILPQPARGEPVDGGMHAKNKALYHSDSAPPPHSYMAGYLWMREQFKADALIHYGTHGTQEWLPGKERGLSVDDYPLLAIGNMPVIYPFIVDNIGEAVQTKRRGRAVNISYQTPPFAPAGLHAVLTQLHDDLHAWVAQDEGAVKEQIRAQLTAAVVKEHIDLDMGWTTERIAREFPAFVHALHDHLHELAQTAQPLGLHTFGKGSDEHGQLATVLMMLGAPFWEATAVHIDGNDEEADEAIVANFSKIAETQPYQLLRKHLVERLPTDALPPELQAMVEQGKRWFTDLQAEGETRGLLAALDARYIPTSYGGDPIKNPDSLPTGRNLYGFDPSRVPTQAAWKAGQQALDQLVAAHQQKTGVTPSKFTFSLWSVETMHHQGLLEAQALWALGVEPTWDAGGRVTDVKLVARQTLGRARIDVVLSATGLYRDHFPNAMKQLARAAQLAAQANDEADNAVAANTRTVAGQLAAQGWRTEAAQKAAETRIFSGASGSYGSGLDDAALATDTWKSKAEGDRKLAELYLRKMQYAYGPDEADWGKSAAELASTAGVGGTAASDGSQAINLYAAHLTGTQGAVLARSSNLYGMLTTDDPFQYLGGIAAAVRAIDSKAPEMFISNLRGSGAGKAENAASFLAKELATRNFHPGHIQALMREGYAGTTQMVDSINNFTGWTTVAREIVRDDQWQEFADVYVRDKHKLGIPQWMERENPHALALMMERMLEMARQGYWQADRAMVDELKAKYKDLAQRFDARTDNRSLQKFVGLSGYGLTRSLSPQETILRSPAPGAAARPVAAPPAAPATPVAPAPMPDLLPAPLPITGIKLEQMLHEAKNVLEPLLLIALSLLFLTPVAGAWQQWRKT